MNNITTALLKLFQSHGVEAIQRDEWIILPSQKMRATASIVSEKSQQGSVILQLDVRLEIGPLRTIIESFAGIGDTRAHALADAFQNFTASSFHVLLAAFFRSSDEQVNQEEWIIGGKKCPVTFGNAACRGTPPVQGEELVFWIKDLREALQKKPLGPGTHWLSFYYGQVQGKTNQCQIMLDNLKQEEMQSEMARLAWPIGEGFYSVRLFMVIQVPGQTTVEDGMTPEDAVARLAELLAPCQSFSQDDAYAAMANAGIPEKLADRAYRFTQVAWGRQILSPLGVSFSPDYVCFNAAGEVIESGPLDNEPCYAAACRLADRYRRTPGFECLALMSASVEVAFKAQQAGSKPENMSLAPDFLFMEEPTQAGMENAQRIMQEHLPSRRRTTPPASQDVGSPKKPWWQFWK